MNVLRLSFLGCMLAIVLTGRAASLQDLFTERLKSAVAVEFFVQDEIERHPVALQGTVIDNNGTIILPSAAILPGVPPSQLKDFKVYRPGSIEPYDATYLGQDALTGWHFIRVEEKLRNQLVPISHYDAITADPALSEELWGIGLRNKDEDFMPYFLSARTALVTKLPQKTAILGSEVAGPGLPVFDSAGRLAGLAETSFGQNFLLFSHNQNGAPILLVNMEESSVVLLADEVLPYLGRIPQSVNGRPIASFGAYGLQPVDPEVAKLLKLDNQPAVVLSDLMEGGPAAQAGLKERDIVLAIDGQPLPRLKPDRVVAGYFGQEVMRRHPGDTMTLTISRDGSRQEVKVTLGDEPKLVREADRHYFDRLGFTVREFLPSDGVVHRVKPSDQSGVVVQFVKPGSPVSTAGLNLDDWVREIDGEEIKTYTQALEKLRSIESDKSRSEFVLLASRGAETSVLRVKLN
jgi:serine protease Do